MRTPNPVLFIALLSVAAAALPAVVHAQESAPKPASVNRVDADAEYANARDRYQHTDTEGAILHLDIALAARPTFANALYLRGLCYQSKGEYDKAIEDFTADLRMRPDDAPAYSNRAFSYGKLNRWKEAAQEMDAYLRLKPDDVEALKNKGIAYYNLYNTKGISDDPKTDPNLLAVREALQSYDAKKPGDSTVTEILLRIEPLIGGDPLAAIQHLEAAFAQDPTNAGTAYHIGTAYQNLDQNDKAIEWFTKSYTLKPDETTLQSRAVAYYSLGSTGQTEALDKAFADTTALLAANPANSVALLLQADINFARKKWPEAGANYSKALTLDLSDKDRQYAGNQMVESYLKTKDYAGLLQSVAAVISADGEKPEYYQYRGIAYLKQKDYPHSIADLTKAVTLKSDDSRTLSLLGQSYMGQKDAASAVSSFEKAMTLAPKDTDIAFAAGHAYQALAEESKNRSQASAAYTKAVALYDRVIGSEAAAPEQKAEAKQNKAICLAKSRK